VPGEWRGDHQNDATRGCTKERRHEQRIDNGAVDGLHGGNTSTRREATEAFITKAEKAKKTPAITPQRSAANSVKAKSKASTGAMPPAG